MCLITSRESLIPCLSQFETRGTDNDHYQGFAAQPLDAYGRQRSAIMHFVRSMRNRAFNLHDDLQGQ